jgi:hypothetical protein
MKKQSKTRIAIAGLLRSGKEALVALRAPGDSIAADLEVVAGRGDLDKLGRDIAERIRKGEEVYN